MTNGIYYNDVECFFTNEGRTSFIKQNNGIKFSKIGAVLLSDYNKSLYHAVTSDNSDTVLNNLTLKQLSNYTQLVFKDIPYNYEGGIYTPQNYDEYNSSLENNKNLIDIKIAYENDDNDDYFSYNFTLVNTTLNVDRNSSEDMNFDGFVLLGLPYKSTPEEQNIEGITEQQTAAVLAVVYFPKDEEKLQVLYNQPSTVAFNVELHIHLAEELNLTDELEYVDSMDRPIEGEGIQLRDAIGLNKVNDANNNRNGDTETVGSDKELLISNVETPDSYDSFTKLNIMTETHDELSANVPQIMLAQTTSGTTKTWNGDRLTINYASGNNGGYFSISEITGTYRNKINADFIGENNIYHTVVSGTYGNSFLFSKANLLANDAKNNSFIHSDYNTFEANNINNIDFINSNFNIVRSQKAISAGSSAEDISLYNSNNNVIHSYCVSSTDGLKDGVLKNAAIINSNGNYIKGKSYSPTDSENFSKPHTTFINSFSSLYNVTENSESVTMIGNTFSWVNAPSGGLIGIGEGLIQDGGTSDKILLGYYNRNSEDPNEVLVVGDGRMNKKWVKGLVSAIPDWNTQLSAYEMMMENISGNGSTAKTANYYRHNIFTVNKNGYVTISDYNSENSARYGFSGITAYNGNDTYELPFERIYNQLNLDAAYQMGEEKLASYSRNIQYLINNTTMDSMFVCKNNVSMTPNIRYSAYLNMTATTSNNTTSYYTSVNNLANNTVFTVTYVPVTNQSYPLDIIYCNRKPGDTVDQTFTASIEPYKSKQFIRLDPNGDTGFYGVTEVD